MGLMGGSLALAIKESFPKTIVHAVVRSDGSKKTILESELADEVFLDHELATNFGYNGYDLVVFSTPVSSILSKISNLPKNTETVFIDLGSTKSTLVEAVNNHFKSDIHNYISTHPMCGSENFGPGASDLNLYKNKLCILCPPSHVNESALHFVDEFWKAISMRTTIMDAKTHDETLAYLSHLPHIVSSILVSIAAANPSTLQEIMKNDKPITGGGFRDMSRIAGTNVDMWISIFQENQSFIYKSLVDFEKKLQSMIEAFHPEKKLDSQQISKLWEDALVAKKTIRKEL